MTDRELLELAAKAARLELFSWYAGDEENSEGILYNDENDCTTYWNPLLCDGDAMRLAVRVGVCLFIAGGGMFVARWHSESQGLKGASEPVAGKSHEDRCAAVRRAIVRAAAEIAQVEL